MPKIHVSSLEGKPLFDIASYARRGLSRRDRLSPDEIEQISRTVRQVPEVIVKVLAKDASKLESVQRHIGYIGRYGELGLETDDGECIRGRDIGGHLVADWDLDLDEHRRQSALTARSGGGLPRLVHKLMLSMPPGTPPKGVLAAARNFLREEFALKHRYAFVLHTDEPHPHVHVVLKAVSEQGVRLHIRKATLREWRQQFARHLRAQGIAANATERAVRGEIRIQKTDGIYRAAQRGCSTHMLERAEAITHELSKGAVHVEAGKARLRETRRQVESGWRSVGAILSKEGRHELLVEVIRFVDRLRPPITEKQLFAQEVLRQRQKFQLYKRGLAAPRET